MATAVRIRAMNQKECEECVKCDGSGIYCEIDRHGQRGELCLRKNAYYVEKYSVEQSIQLWAYNDSHIPYRVQLRTTEGSKSLISTPEESSVLQPSEGKIFTAMTRCCIDAPEVTIKWLFVVEDDVTGSSILDQDDQPGTSELKKNPNIVEVQIKLTGCYFMNTILSCSNNGVPSFMMP